MNGSTSIASTPSSSRRSPRRVKLLSVAGWLSGRTTAVGCGSNVMTTAGNPAARATDQLLDDRLMTRVHAVEDADGDDGRTEPLGDVIEPAPAFHEPPARSRRPEERYGRAVSDGVAVSTRDRGVAFATGPVLAIAGAVGLLLLVTSGRYGYHRDELYFVEAGRHLAWGYPDQPPLTPLLARLMDTIGPGSVTVLRLPSVVGAMLVVRSPALAREFGGRAFAQVLAALAVGTGVYALVVGHLLSTSSIDLLAWVTITWLVVRILRTGDQRLWLAVGAVTGVGLLNKHLVLFLVTALLAGAVLVPRRRKQARRSPWLWAGVLVALALDAEPGVAGDQRLAAAGARRGHPRGVRRHRRTDRVRRPQLVLFSPVAMLLAVFGLLRLWRDPKLAPYRLLAWAWLALLVLFFVTGGKGYYLGGLYPALIAAGALGVEQRVGERRGRKIGWLAAVIVAAIIGMPIALPVLPASTLASSPYAGPAEDALETVGWPEFAAAVQEAYDQVPAGGREIGDRVHGQLRRGWRGCALRPRRSAAAGR